MIFRYLFAASAVLLHTVTAPAPRSPYLMSIDADDWTPDYVWMLDPGQQGVSDNTNRIPIYLHNADLVTGPSYGAKSIGAVEFKGDSSSYAVIPNDMQKIDSTFVFTWMMLLKPASTSQKGVIFEISDGTTGIQIKQDSTTVEVRAQDTVGSWHVITANNVFTSTKWTFIALSYANMKLGRNGEEIVFFHGLDGLNGYDYVKEQTAVQNTKVLKGTGDIRIGASANETEAAFRGQVACIRYHQSYLVKTVDAHTVSCDPNDVSFADMLTSLSGNSIPYVESTTAFVVTTVATTQQEMITTQQTTLKKETTTNSVQALTTETEGTTVNSPYAQLTTAARTISTEVNIPAQGQTAEVDKTITERENTNVDGISTQGGTTTKDEITAHEDTIHEQTTLRTHGTQSMDIEQASMATAPFTQTYDAAQVGHGNALVYSPTDKCVYLQEIPGPARFSTETNVLADIEVDSLNACVGLCTSVFSCEAVAIETAVKDSNSAGRCILGGSGFTTVMDPGFYVYTTVCINCQIGTV